MVIGGKRAELVFFSRKQLDNFSHKFFLREQRRYELFPSNASKTITLTTNICIKGKSPGGQVSYLQWAVHHQKQSQPYISTCLVTLWFETIFSNPRILKSPNEQTWLFTLSCISLILLCNCSLLTFWLKNCDILAAVLKGGLSGFSRKHNFKKASMGQ